MIDVALDPPRDALDDDLGKDAFDAIQRLIKQVSGVLSLDLVASTVTSSAIG